MSESKSGWPLTREFADGLNAFASRFAQGVSDLREVALDALEAAVSTQEAVMVLKGRLAYINVHGSRPTYWDLYTWCRETGQPEMAAFLYANRGNPRITGLFGSAQPSLEPPEDPYGRA